jgi:hypothetical protein
MSTAAYERDHSKLPEIEESALDTADVGLYRVAGKSKRGDYYRPETDDWLADAPQIMLARVDDGPTYLPSAVERAEIRPDGKRLIVAWVMA